MQSMPLQRTVDVDVRSSNYINACCITQTGRDKITVFLNGVDSGNVISLVNKVKINYYCDICGHSLYENYDIGKFISQNKIVCMILCNKTHMQLMCQCAGIVSLGGIASDSVHLINNSSNNIYNAYKTSVG